MPTSPAPLPEGEVEPYDGVVAVLRAAGCVFAEDEANLLLDAARSPAHLRTMMDRRVAGIPLEAILGWVDFYGLRVGVDPGVFVPRRRTEVLVREALALLPPAGVPVVVDLFCGCGAVGLALATASRRIELAACDIDPAAVRCAARNLAPVGGRVFEGDLYEPLPVLLRGRVDILLANAPYVPTDAVALMPPEARLHEPQVALDGGIDGLDLQRRTIAGALEWLSPGGSLLVETSGIQADRSLDLMARAGLAARLIADDDLDATVIIGTRRCATAAAPTAASVDNVHRRGPPAPTVVEPRSGSDHVIRRSSVRLTGTRHQRRDKGVIVNTEISTLMQLCRRPTAEHAGIADNRT